MIVEKNIYFPLFASRDLNGGFQAEEESKLVWQLIQDLPVERRNILLSQNIAEAITSLDEKFHLPEKFIEYITVLVREMFFGNITEQDILRVLRQEMVKFPNIQADILIQHVQLNIFRAQPDPEDPEEDEFVETIEESLIPQENMRQYTLLDALSKYPYIGNQPITTDNIKLKSQVALVRPTLTNWLKNYRDELGIGTHDAVARAKFLFESKNTHKLPGKERERIHTLVRSLEDNELLNIDTKKQLIFFTDTVPKDSRATNSRQSEEVTEEATQDIFERFQNVNASPFDTRTQLGAVGTQTFGGGKIPAAAPDQDETSVLSRIKNMAVGIPKANAPAPREDFTVPQSEPLPQSVLSPEPQVPLGTLRFSAKHILPAERQNLQKAPATVFAQPLGADNRMEHFRPQPVFIPGAPVPQSIHTSSPQAPIPESVNKSVPAAPIQPITPVPAAPTLTPPQASPVQTVNMVQSETVAPTPGVKVHLEEPRSMFRIKPNRD